MHRGETCQVCPRFIYIVSARALTYPRITERVDEEAAREAAEREALNAAKAEDAARAEEASPASPSTRPAPGEKTGPSEPRSGAGDAPRRAPEEELGMF